MRHQYACFDQLKITVFFVVVIFFQSFSKQLINTICNCNNIMQWINIYSKRIPKKR